MKTEIYKAEDGWRWRKTADNNEIVGASSESFTTRQGAEYNLQLMEKRKPAGLLVYVLSATLLALGIIIGIVI